MILCIGTTPTVQRTMVFDRLTVDEVNRATEVTEYSSGKAINVARVLTQIGEAERISISYACQLLQRIRSRLATAPTQGQNEETPY